MCGLPGGACAAGREGRMRPPQTGARLSELRTNGRGLGLGHDRIPSRRYKRGMSDSIERLSFELTTRALAEQERALSGVRSGAGTLLGAASIAGSFLGSRLAGHQPNAWGVLATIAFVSSASVAIWVLVPRDLALTFRGSELIAASDALGSAAIAEGYRAVCAWIEPQLERNRRTLDALTNWLTCGCLLLETEVVMQTISVMIGG
jgi:hypothetical protein